MTKEIPLKQWCAEEAIRTGLTWHAIYDRLRRPRRLGQWYPQVTVRSVNQSVVFVTDNRPEAK